MRPNRTVPGLHFLDTDNVFLGMLANVETVEMVSQVLRQHNVPVVVLDPVLLPLPAVMRWFLSLTNVGKGDDLY